MLIVIRIHFPLVHRLEMRFEHPAEILTNGFGVGYLLAVRQRLDRAP
jgi:hypothetical protein